jgi:tight adherence protein C
MDAVQVFQGNMALWSPVSFGVLAGLATVMVWLALAPARPHKEVEDRLDELLSEVDIIEAEEMRRPLASRTLIPALRGVLRLLGRFAPKRNIEATQKLLIQAGEPGRLTALDFLGLRLLCVALLGGGYILLYAAGNSAQTPMEALRYGAILAVAGYILPQFLLRRRARSRQHEIARALPDALDMLTVGVEAGLAFESALLKVGERWQNALTEELRMAVADMRIGTARDVALRRLADRTGVEELGSFVAVLIQSSQLGVSIAQVLHQQAEQMRVRRRQRAEELARQASVKMVFPLVFLIFPALFVVILGPSIPAFGELFQTLDRGFGGGGGVPLR